ncbi:MAG: glycosyltransferase family 4 protein, partial [Planctomycetota bacterium]|nr:glycosyltransferase family 4 protein [Planctomycetota bacterium]
MDEKIAIVHHYLVSLRGGEKVLKALYEVYPNATLFTLFANTKTTSRFGRKPNTSWLQGLFRFMPSHKILLPFFPLAAENLDLQDFDIVITSDASFVKGIITRPDSLHICYCHSPPRYVWDMEQEYLNSSPLVVHPILRVLSHYLRLADFAAAQRVDFFVANSNYTAARIRKFYRR